MFKATFSILSKAHTLHQTGPRFFFGSKNSFFVHQFHTGCLAEYAYYIESNGEAAIIDPLREVKPYLEMAKSRNAKIKYILETHFHADFISGHVDLSKITGAPIVYGPSAKAQYDLYNAKDNEELPLGDISLKVLHTPGHTTESSCYLLLDQDKKPYSVFTGDTLFLGEVGRPDLAAQSTLTKEDLASLLYDSLRNKLLTLDDDVIVYPTHGAGSSCGKNISKGNSSTIGEQRKNNYALQPMTKEEFTQIVAGNLPIPPKYFFYDSEMNKTNLPELEKVLKKNTTPLSVRTTKNLMSQGAIIIDCRDVKDCQASGIIPGSINISLSMPFAVWVGTLLKSTDKLIVLAEPGKEEEAIIRLARVGFDNCLGYIKGGIEEWKSKEEPLTKIETVDMNSHLRNAKELQNLEVLDVRNIPEWENGVYPGSVRIPLGELEGRLSELKRDKPYHILCKSGMRATIAYSLLKRQGFEDLTVMLGGADKLTESGFKFDKLDS